MEEILPQLPSLLRPRVRHLQCRSRTPAARSIGNIVLVAGALHRISFKPSHRTPRSIQEADAI